MIEFSKNLNKKAAAVALIGAAAATAWASAEKGQPQPKDLIYPVVGTSTVGEAGSGTEHEAAEDAIEKGLKKAFRALGMDKDEQADQLKKLSTFDQATEAVEMAREDGTVPDLGDGYTVSIDVRKDYTDKISFDVTDAEIVDVPNNQS